eukprot:6196964-Pleurochrysis_carterae.AAC.1
MAILQTKLRFIMRAGERCIGPSALWGLRVVVGGAGWVRHQGVRAGFDSVRCRSGSALYILVENSPSEVMSIYI